MTGPSLRKGSKQLCQCCHCSLAEHDFRQNFREAVARATVSSSQRTHSAHRRQELTGSGGVPGRLVHPLMRSQSSRNCFSCSFWLLLRICLRRVWLWSLRRGCRWSPRTQTWSWGIIWCSVSILFFVSWACQCRWFGTYLNFTLFANAFSSFFALTSASDTFYRVS